MEFKKGERKQRKKMSRGVTLNEMENVAISFSGNEMGNVIDLADTVDGLGLDMLANPSRTIQINSSSSSGPKTTFSVPQESSGMGDIEFSRMDNMEPITLNMGSDSSVPINIELKKSETESSGGGIFSNFQTATGPNTNLSPSSSHMSQEDEKKEKIEFLNKLQRLETKGFALSRKFTMDNTLEEVKQEYLRLVDARNLEASLRFQRQALVGVVTGMEWLNGRFDPFDLKLDGWSESVHENVDDFDEIFEELYDKYKERGKMPPEMRLMMTLAGSGFMCHVSNSFLRSRVPQSADDILKQNPELARQFATAAAAQAGPGFGKFMGMAMGAPEPTAPQNPAGAFFGSQQQSAQQQQPRAPQAVASVEPRQVARREMKGPSGVDDIVKAFDEARLREANEIPQTQVPRAAVSAAQSIVSADDIQSATESTRTGRTGGRRRRAAVGDTLSLNV